MSVTAAGDAYRQQGRLADAKAELQMAMDLAPDDWRWPYWLGALQIDTGDYKSAESNLKIALEKTPDNARVLYNLGLVNRKQGKLEEASKAYQDALKLDSSYFQAAMALATVLTLQERYDDALEIYKRTVMMRPADWRTWGSLATALEFTDAILTKLLALAAEQSSWRRQSLRPRLTIPSWCRGWESCTPAFGIRLTRCHSCANRSYWHLPTRTYGSGVLKLMSCLATATKP